MRVDFSEPECSTCFHYSTSGILNPHHQETEPSNVIASSVNSVPVTSEPVQAALGHNDSAAIASTTSTLSSPIHSSSSPIRTETLTNQNQNQNTTSVLQPLNQTNFDLSGFTIPKPPQTGSVQAPVHAFSPFSFGTDQDFAKTTYCALASNAAFADGVSFARTDIGYAPNLFVPSTTSTVVFGTTPVSVSSVCNPTTPKNPFGYFPKASSSSSNLWDAKYSSNPNLGSSSQRYVYQDFGNAASSPSLSGNCYDFGRTDVGYAPNHSARTDVVSFPGSFSASNYCYPSSNPNLGSSSASNYWYPSSNPNLGSSSQLYAYHLDASYNNHGDNGSRSMFDPPQGNYMNDFGYMNGFGSYSCGFDTSSSQPFLYYYGAPTTNLFPSSSSSSSLFSSGKSSRYPGYVPTPDTQGDTSNNLVSISASDAYKHKSHEELRLEDYKQGDKGGLFAPACISPFGSAFSSLPSGVATYLGQTNAPFTGFATTLCSSSSTSPSSSSTTFPTTSSLFSSFQRPYETVVVSSPETSRCCTACGATTSSFTGATTTPSPPSDAATSQGLLAAQSTSLGLQASPTLLGTNLAAPSTNPDPQGKSQGLEASPTLLDTNLATQSTNLAAQVTSQASPTLVGTNLAAQGTSPGLEASPTPCGTSLAAQGRTPTFQAYPTLFHDQDIIGFVVLIILICVLAFGLRF